MDAAIDKIIDRALKQPLDECLSSTIEELIKYPDSEIFSIFICLLHDSSEQLRLLAIKIALWRFQENHILNNNIVLNLIEMLKSENRPIIIEQALSILENRITADSIIAVSQLADNSSENVRAISAKLMGTIETPVSIYTLIKLSRDEHPMVRDWATFGLAICTKSISPEITEALSSRLEDPDPDTRAEALMGLALRRNEVVVSALIRELHSKSIGRLVLEAAAELKDQRLCNSLKNLKSSWSDDHDDMTEVLNSAINACCQESS